MHTPETSVRLDLTALRAKQAAVAVVGLGYVGLPLAVALARHFTVIGFDIDRKRIADLHAGRDDTGETAPGALSAGDIAFTSDPEVLAQARLFIVAVPTPIDANRRPDLGPTRAATSTVARALRPGSVVVFESTVYPGVTEEECVPLLEAESGFQCGRDFWVGYSPERINPGDTTNRLENIVKVVAGQDQPTAELLAEFYGTVIEAGIHTAPTIKVAEAAKVIENTQRDLNIALMNELAQIFHKMGIDTQDVLAAAGTKWNFLPFRPGLVGGHCIGVDPYYLTYKAEALGLHPQIILAGRRINDGMGAYVAQTTVKSMIQKGVRIQGARVAVLGLAFKENVPDLRNTRVVDIVHELQEYQVEVVVHDPLVSSAEALHEYGLELVSWSDLTALDAVILAVPHAAYLEHSPASFQAVFADPQRGALMDIKGALDPGAVEAQGLAYWRL